MDETIIKIMAYLYEKGLGTDKNQGYEQGVFRQEYFNVDDMKESLHLTDNQIGASIEILLEHHYIDFVKSRIGLNEIGWATYIDRYYQR